MTNKKTEIIDPIDDFVNYWTHKCEEIKNTPIPSYKRDEYLKTFEDHMRSFEESNGIIRPSRGFQKIDDDLFHFMSPEQITEKKCKSKYSAKEIFYKLDTVNTSVDFAISQGEEKYKENKRIHQEEMMKNKKGFFDNAQIILVNLWGKLH